MIRLFLLAFLSLSMSNVQASAKDESSDTPHAQLSPQQLYKFDYSLLIGVHGNGDALGLMVATRYPFSFLTDEPGFSTYLRGLLLGAPNAYRNTKNQKFESASTNIVGFGIRANGSLNQFLASYVMLGANIMYPDQNVVKDDSHIWGFDVTFGFEMTDKTGRQAFFSEFLLFNDGYRADNLEGSPMVFESRGLIDMGLRIYFF